MILIFTSSLLKLKRTQSKYLEPRLIVFENSLNTFQNIAYFLLGIIKEINSKRSWDLSLKVDKKVRAQIRRGNVEQEELYHGQLFSEV